MSAKEDPTVEMNDNEIHELNPSALQAHFLHAAFDFHKIAKDTEAEFQEVCEQLQKSYNPTMRNEHNRSEFLQSKKSSEEIKKYIETYNGFVVVEKAIEYSASSCAGCLQEREEGEDPVE